MAKFKPAKPKSKTLPGGAPPQAVGCIILIGLVLILIFLSIYFTVVSK